MAKAFLEMTLNCARCHDHKFDPVSQTAYYQFRAIFEPHNVRTDRVPGQPNIMQDGLPRIFDADLKAETFLYERGNEKHPDKDSPMQPAVPAVPGGDHQPQAVSLPVEAWYPALTDFIVEEQLAAARSRLVSAAKKLDDQKARLSSVEGELLELQHTAARVRLNSLEARLAADRAKCSPSNGKGDDGAQRLAVTAANAERQLRVGQAELTVAQKTSAVAAAESSDVKDQKKKQDTIEKSKKNWLLPARR